MKDENFKLEEVGNFHKKESKVYQRHTENFTAEAVVKDASMKRNFHKKVAGEILEGKGLDLREVAKWHEGFGQRLIKESTNCQSDEGIKKMKEEGEKHVHWSENLEKLSKLKKGDREEERPSL